MNKKIVSDPNYLTSKLWHVTNLLPAESIDYSIWIPHLIMDWLNFQSCGSEKVVLGSRIFSWRQADGGNIFCSFNIKMYSLEKYLTFLAQFIPKCSKQTLLSTNIYCSLFCPTISVRDQMFPEEVWRGVSRLWRWMEGIPLHSLENYFPLKV